MSEQAANFVTDWMKKHCPDIPHEKRLESAGLIYDFATDFEYELQVQFAAKESEAIGLTSREKNQILTALLGKETACADIVLILQAVKELHSKLEASEKAAAERAQVLCKLQRYYGFSTIAFSAEINAALCGDAGRDYIHKSEAETLQARVKELERRVPADLEPDQLERTIAGYVTDHLEPCPLCGERALLVSRRNTYSGLFGGEVICSGCHSIKVFCCAKTRAEAQQGVIEQWNKRHTLKQPTTGGAQ